MWLQGKALSSHALPPDRSPKLRSGPGASYAGALSRAIGPWSNIEAIQPASLTGPCGTHAHRLHRGTSADCFRQTKKTPLILLTNPQQARQYTPSKAWYGCKAVRVNGAGKFHGL